MKRFEIKRLFISAYNRLDRSIGLASDFSEDLDEVLWFINPKCPQLWFDERDVEVAVKSFSLVLSDMETWISEIYPKEPSYTDKQAIKRFFRAIKFADSRLEKIQKLMKGSCRNG